MTTKTKIVLLDKTKREDLSEGRSSGVGFAFCKREGDTLTTVQPISPCKDYLNDVVYTERTSKPYSVWGLSTTYHGLFKDAEFAHIVIGCCKPRHASHPGYAKEVKYMDSSIKNVAILVSRLEALIFNALADKQDKANMGGARFAAKAPSPQHDMLHNLTGCQVDQVGPNRYYFQISTFWTHYTYLISLWSLVVRLGVEGEYNGTDDPMEFLSSGGGSDGELFSKAIDKVEKILAGIIPVQELAGISPHDCGIVSFSGF